MFRKLKRRIQTRREYRLSLLNLERDLLLYRYRAVYADISKLSDQDIIDWLKELEKIVGELEYQQEHGESVTGPIVELTCETSFLGFGVATFGPLEGVVALEPITVVSAGVIVVSSGLLVYSFDKLANRRTKSNIRKIDSDVFAELVLRLQQEFVARIEERSAYT